MPIRECLRGVVKLFMKEIGDGPFQWELYAFLDPLDDDRGRIDSLPMVDLVFDLFKQRFGVDDVR